MLPGVLGMVGPESTCFLAGQGGRERDRGVSSDQGKGEKENDNRQDKT